MKRALLAITHLLIWMLSYVSASERPNIIIVMVDDMGFSDIGSYGSEIATPHLDSLANNGVRFSQFYNTGRCCPTRASLLTGLYAHETGVGWMTDDQNHPGYRGRLNENCVTIAQVLKDAGYFTAMTGKWHVGFEPGVTPRSRGFDRSLNLVAGGLHFSNQTGSKGNAKLFLDDNEIAKDDPSLNPPWYATDLWTRQGLQFVDQAIESDKPFFWYLAHVAPHFPCMAPESTIDQHRGRYMEGWDALGLKRHQRQVASGLIDGSWVPTARPSEIPAWDSLDDAAKKRYDDMMAIYAAMITDIDNSIGQLVQGLKTRGQLDNTLILFLSDNGGNAESGIAGHYEGTHPGNPDSNVFIGRCWAHLNNTPFRQYKHFNHEGGIASPLIASWPAKIQPRSGADDWIDTPTHLIDLMATCVDLSTATYPDQWNDQPTRPMRGQSLQPLLTGEGSFPSRSLYWEHEGNAAIRNGEYKLVRAGLNGPWELYNIHSDRTEQHDLAAQMPDLVRQLRTQWQTWAKANNVMPKPESGKKKRRGKAS